MPLNAICNVPSFVRLGLLKLGCHASIHKRRIILRALQLFGEQIGDVTLFFHFMVGPIFSF